MLTPSMIAAENFTVALTDDQVMNLAQLCETAFPAEAVVWSASLRNYLSEERGNPTNRTKALKAVLTQLDGLPAEVAESQGDINQPTFFSTTQNWRSLALDVLTVFKLRVGVPQQSFGIQQRKVEDLLLEDNPQLALDTNLTGRRY